MKNRMLLILLLMPLGAFCQNENLARLSVVGAVSELGISPSEEIWIATKAGNVYYTKQTGDLWHLGPFGSLDPNNFSSGATFERVNFFSDNTLMISGFIQENGAQDFVYWSGDHGKTWKKIRFGTSSWIDAAFINDNGKAWMSGNSQLIYFTEDSGKTWRSFDKVERTGNLRFSTIHFAKDELTGLFGSFWNVLYRTSDNCKTWEKLPTPLSQNKYQQISKVERPDIRKVRQFGHRYIVNQQGRVFETRSENIDWQRLEGAVDFEVTASERLYVIYKDLHVELLDDELNMIWTSADRLNGYVRAIAVRNESLFVLTATSIYKINQNNFERSDLWTNDIRISDPYMIVKHNGDEYGFDGSDILLRKNGSKQWTRLMTVGFQIGMATVFEDKLIVSDFHLKDYFALNTSARVLDKFELPPNLFEVTNNRIEEFHIETGSQGCFHSENKRRSYSRKGDAFELTRNEGNTGFLTNMPSKLSIEIINNLVKIIDQSRFSKITVAEFGFTPADIASFKKFVDDKQRGTRNKANDHIDYDLYAFPGEKTDFEFYKRTADSIHSVSSDIVDNAFWRSYGNWSTTRESRRIIFVFQDGRELIMENSDDKPNYLFTPWIINFGGVMLTTNSIQFGEAIKEITGRRFFGDTVADKNYAIFKIADYLYRIKLQAMN
jgi:photosystem II stability/assembly factor-like uncharacterized protein